MATGIHSKSFFHVLASDKQSSADKYLCAHCALIALVLYTEFIIKYYGYSFDYIITITNQFMINTHT